MKIFYDDVFEFVKFPEGQAYKLVAVTDKEGKDKTKTGDRVDFYEGYIGRVSDDFKFDEKPSYEGMYRVMVTFSQNSTGEWSTKYLYTSPVECVEDTAEGFCIVTCNSVYVFEKAELKPVVYQEEANLIELYMAGEHSYLFSKGFYYDENKEPHELCEQVHVGTFQDSVLIQDKEYKFGTVCRYFPFGGYDIMFYDTLYGQQEYSVPILIHNTGRFDLDVRFEFDDRRWTIKPGESERILPDSSKE